MDSQPHEVGRPVASPCARAILPVSAAQTQRLVARNYVGASEFPSACLRLRFATCCTSTSTVTHVYWLHRHIRTMFNNLVQKIALQKAGLGNLSLPKDNPFAGGSTKNGAQDRDGGGFKNPFANAQWPPKAFASWQAPPPPQSPVNKPPKIGDRAPSDPKVRFPTVDGRPVVVLFMRFCGCPCKFSPDLLHVLSKA
jgi:hypothetical protein